MGNDFSGRNLVKRYGGRAVVNDVDVTVGDAEIVGLLGPNGAGKTTTFQMMVGLVRPDGGSVFLNGQEVTDLPMYRRAGRGVGYLPQESSVFRGLTVRENLMAILELVESDPGVRRSRCEALIEDFGLRGLEEARGDSLSGGERRRLESARAQITDPNFLLLDEPFAGVDPIALEEVQNLIRRLQERGIGVLITDHNVRETLAITDRSYIMNEGEILIAGDAPTLINDPDARDVYLGSSFDAPSAPASRVPETGTEPTTESDADDGDS